MGQIWALLDVNEPKEMRTIDEKPERSDNGDIKWIHILHQTISGK